MVARPVLNIYKPPTSVGYKHGTGVEHTQTCKIATPTTSLGTGVIASPCRTTMM